MSFRLALRAGSALAVLCLPAAAQNQAEQVVVYGTLPSGAGLAPDKLSTSLQSLSASDITAAHGPTVLDSLGTQVAGISLNDSQGNAMFEDVRFHGFEASPLEGTAQGIAVYQNGIRLNEAFGDTVNWDAIPEAAIARMDNWSANPVYGLNALGGAINVVMKDGFSYQGGQGELQGGSYAHGMASVEYGGNDGDFVYYGTAEGITDAGWRLHSGSNVGRLYGDLGWRFGSSEIHVVASGAQSGLGVVGPTPIQLAAQDSAAVYTWPQTTQNRIGSLAVNGATRFSDDWQLSGNAYVRVLRQRHIDGNDADVESCSTKGSYGGDLCLQDDGFPAPAGGKTVAWRNQFTIANPAGQVFPFNKSVVYGTDDRTFTDTVTQGAALQLTGSAPLLGLANYFTAGGSVDHSSIGYRSNSTLGQILPNLDVAVLPGLAGAGSIVHTLGDLGYAPADLAGTTDYYGLYAVDAIDLLSSLTLTAGARLNVADSATRDRSSLFPELTGSHGYTHLNPLAGLSYKIGGSISLFGGYSQNNRAPTPLELDCANASLPCLLADSLVSDPPLKQVVAESFEAGFRGAEVLWDGALSWSASVYRTDTHNDIVALGSVIQGRGYYANVPDTRRQGLDLSARFKTEGWSAYASYSWLDATYQFTGALSSPNNPMADDNGNVTVTPGDRIPMNPANTFKAGGDVEILPGFSLGGDIGVTGSQYYEGDYANQNQQLSAYWLLNLRASYALSEHWSLFGLVNNVFDRHAASYGTYFDPSNTVPLFVSPLTDVRSVTLIQPISFRLGLTLRL